MYTNGEKKKKALLQCHNHYSLMLALHLGKNKMLSPDTSFTVLREITVHLLLVKVDDIPYCVF